MISSSDSGKDSNTSNHSQSQDQGQESHRVEVIETRLTVGSETSFHKIFVRGPGRSIREAIEPICISKGIELSDLGVYVGSERAAALPLEYDIYFLTGHALHVVDYKAPVVPLDEVDYRLLNKKSKSTPLTQRKKLSEVGIVKTTPTAHRKNKSSASASRVSSFASRSKEPLLNQKLKPPLVANKSAPSSKDRSTLATNTSEMYPQRLSTGSMLAQPGGRRPRQSDAIPPMNLSSRLLGLSEGSQKHSTVEDDNGNEKHRKQMSLPSDDFHHPSGEISPGGTLVKNRGSSAKLSLFSLQPQNSKEREKMEILADLLEQWGKTGPPELPALCEVGLPKFDPSQFEIEDHWTSFIDKTDLTQRQKDQQEALWELLYTELEYIRALYVIHDLFICCLLNIQNSGVLNEIDIAGMFSNVDELATTNSTFWSTELIAVLEHSRKNKCLFNPSLLKPAFTNFSERFMPYTRYCIEQKKCSDYVKKNYQELAMFKSFVAWAEAQKQCNRLKLHDLLVKPMQRLTRYALLLRAIHKKTDEESVKQDLMEMINNVDKFVSDVDDTLTRADEKEKLIQTAARIDPYDAVDVPMVDAEISKVFTQTYMALDLLSPMPGCGSQLRYNLLEGPLKLRDMGTKIDVHCVLFTDMLLFTKPFKRDKLRIIKPPIRIDSLSIHEMKDSPYLLLVHLTDFGVAQAAYTLQGDNITRWVKTFRKAQSMYMKAKERTRNESLRLSLTDPDLDDLGFCGPLNSKAVADPVFSDGIENDSDVATPGNSSPQIQRANSFTSLIGAETEDGDAGIPTSRGIRHIISSPEIGRKHHTLPHNYKPPPQVSLQRKSSSSSGESNNNRTKSSASGRRRKTTGRTPVSSSFSAFTSRTNNTDSISDDKAQAGSSYNALEDSDDDFAMSSQLNCGTGSSIVKTDSFSSTDGPLMGAVDPPCNPSSSDSRPTPLSQEPSSSTHNKTLTHSVHSASSLTNGLAHGHSRSKKANHIGMLRMKNFQDFLNESSPGVEI